MSIRVDSVSLIAGALVVGNRGLGVFGSDIPSGGDDGASFLYNDLTLPDDAGKEIRGFIEVPPSAGNFFAFEDGSFTFTDAPDGSYSFTYRLYEDGADLGTASSTVSIGATAAVINLVGSNCTQTATSGTGAVTVGPPVAATTVAITLVNTLNNPRALLSGLKWAFFDQATPDLFGLPVAKGIGEVTDGSGILAIDITGTALYAGNTGWLIVTDSDGSAATAHKAFCGPVVVS